MMRNYTARQVEIMRLIRDETQKTGLSPSLAEMSRVLNIAGETMFEHVRRLEMIGALRKVPSMRPRGYMKAIEILDPDFMPKLQRDELVAKLLAMLAATTGKTEQECLAEAQA